jgi:hypothetical protein
MGWLGVVLGLLPASAQTFERARPEVESATIVLYPDGFAPSEVRLREGRVLLRVLNRVGLDELPLLFERDAEALRPAVKVHEEDVPRERRAWKPEAELAPGVYTLSVKGRPEWICRITVVADPDKR